MPMPGNLNLSRFGAVMQEVYDILVEDGRQWHLTSGSTAITLPEGDGYETYQPGNIGRDEVASEVSIDRSSLSVYVPFESPVALLFRDYPPSDIVRIRIREVELTNTDVSLVWFGRVTNVMWGEDNVALNVESAFTSLKRLGLRRDWQITCPWALYSQVQGECGVSKDAYGETKTVDLIASDNGTYLTISGGLTPNIYGDGEINWVNNKNGQIERRSIQSNSDETMRVSGRIVGLAPGQDVTVWRGCNKRIGVGGCQDFNNKRRYGGDPFAPSDSPFGSKNLFVGT